MKMWARIDGYDVVFMTLVVFLSWLLLSGCRKDATYRRSTHLQVQGVDCVEFNPHGLDEAIAFCEDGTVCVREEDEDTYECVQFVQHSPERAP